MQEDVFQRYLMFMLVCVCVKKIISELVGVFGCTNIMSFGFVGSYIQLYVV